MPRADNDTSARDGITRHTPSLSPDNGIMLRFTGIDLDKSHSALNIGQKKRVVITSG